MFRLEITESAEADLDSITDYIGFELNNPQAAESLLDEIDRACDVIGFTPEVFPLCADARLADMGYRKVVVRSYIMIYEIDAEDESVRVLRFFHGSENYSAKL